MKWENIDEQRCTIARTLAIIGDRWTLLILRDCFFGMRQFEHFQKDLGLTRHVLTERLKKLVTYNVLEKVKYQETPKRYEYHLTERGKDLYPILMSISSWGERWTSNTEIPPFPKKHRKCGHIMEPEFVCSHCSEKISPYDVIPSGCQSLESFLQDLDQIAPMRDF